MPNDLEDFLAKHPEWRRLSDLIGSVGAESERGMAVLVAAELDRVLELLLKAYFEPGKHCKNLFEGGTPPLGSFSAKIDLARALCLITEEEWADLQVIRRIRNDFAHRPNVKFEDAKIASWASRFVDAKAGKGGAEVAFKDRAIDLISSLEEGAVEAASKRRLEEIDGCGFYRRG